MGMKFNILFRTPTLTTDPKSTAKNINGVVPKPNNAMNIALPKTSPTPSAAANAI